MVCLYVFGYYAAHTCTKVTHGTHNCAPFYAAVTKKKSVVNTHLWVFI